MPDVFQYLDYRAFLRDYYQEKKAASKTFSYVNFARKAKISSSGFLLHVIKGERNLTGPVLVNVAQAMGFDRPQTEYFGDLVAFDQAKSQAEKNFRYGKIMAQRRSAQVTQLEDSQYAFYSDWHHSVIRELAPLLVPGTAPAHLAKLVIPAISAGEAGSSLKLQEGLGLLRKSPEGGYAQSEPFIGGSGAPHRKLAITRYQRAMLEVAGQAWDNFPENAIAMQTATLSLSAEAAQAAMAEMKVFLKRLLALAQADTLPAERVYQVNLNFFPVSKTVEGKQP